MSDSNKVTKISEIGEFGLIDRLKKKISLNNNLTVKGIGDDCAVIKYQEKNKDNENNPDQDNDDNQSKNNVSGFFGENPLASCITPYSINSLSNCSLTGNI